MASSLRAQSNAHQHQQMPATPAQPGARQPMPAQPITPPMQQVPAAPAPPSVDLPMTQGVLDLSSDMRLAWEQHIYWTRMLLISIAHRLPDQAATTARLLENPADIAAIFATYYGPDVARTISTLLTEHLAIGGELMTALRDGNTAAAQALTRRWYTNADQMADAFASINPYYDREMMREMLYEHLQLTTDEVSMRLAGNFVADIEAFDRVEMEAMLMADHFTAGIVQQFPRRFE